MWDFKVYRRVYINYFALKPMIHGSTFVEQQML